MDNTGHFPYYPLFLIDTSPRAPIRKCKVDDSKSVYIHSQAADRQLLQLGTAFHCLGSGMFSTID